MSKCLVCNGSGKEYDLDKHKLSFVPAIYPDCTTCRGTGQPTETKEKM